MINAESLDSKNSSSNPKTGGSTKVGSYRWSVCALLFFATTIIYVDRQALGILAPLLQKDIGWNEIEYGYIVAAFTAAYAIGLLIAGRIIDRVGTKIGYLLSIFVWSVAAMGHALVTSAFGFGVARFSLGLGESANFPAAIKAIAEWFPKKERAYATGWFNSGANIGAVVAPLVVPWITLTWGWQAVFIFIGLLGFIWMFFWWWIYELPENHKKVSREEIAHIHSDQAERETGRIPWLGLLKVQTNLVFHGRQIPHRSCLVVLYLLAAEVPQPTVWFGPCSSRLAVNCYLHNDKCREYWGGWLSGALIKRGASINKGRKIVMLISALLVVPIVFASAVPEWWAVLLIGIAAAAHQSWSNNLFTTVSDMFPKKAVGSVVGLGGMAGALSGALVAAAAGFILQFTGSYLSLFIMAGSAYLVALFVINFLVPEIKEIQI